MTPQELFGGIVEVILNCKDTILDEEGFVDEKKTEITSKSVKIVNELLRWKLECEEERKFSFPSMSTEDRKYTSCDWIANKVVCFSHAIYRGELNLLKWIKNTVKDKDFFKVDSFTAMVSVSKNATKVLKWLSEEYVKVFGRICLKFLDHSISTFEAYQIYLQYGKAELISSLFDSVYHFVCNEDLDQLSKYLDVCIKDPEDNMFDCLTDVLEKCADDVFDLVMSKYCAGRIIDRSHSPDIKKLCKFLEKYYRDVKEDITDVIKIMYITSDVDEKDILRLFDACTIDNFFGIIEGNRTAVVKWLIKYRRDALKDFFKEYEFEDIISYFQYIIHGHDHDEPVIEPVVMIYEAINT